MNRIAIIGSHGLYANYGGWDQLVKNLAELKSLDYEYLIFNSADTKLTCTLPPRVKVKRLAFKASGYQGLIYDFWSILISYFTCDTLLLLGVQGMPLIMLLSIFKRVNIVSNVGGVEWERPKFGRFARLYLKLCFNLSFNFSSSVILDNKHYLRYSPGQHKSKIVVIPYGGDIDTTLCISDEMRKKYSFLDDQFFLSISRSLEDNCLDELCDCFSKLSKKLVLISNFTNSNYGLYILKKYKSNKNITLINGLYNKPELDLIRRSCHAYIHTHTLCGTAPSLVEMIVCASPIISIDNPQNRFTLREEGYYYKNYDDLYNTLINKNDFAEYIPTESLRSAYHWKNIIGAYESTFQTV